jgi:excisionase family DNA binding protein
MAMNQATMVSENGTVEPFINKGEVARRLQKKLRTVDNWMRQGILPYYKIGRSVSFKWSEIEAALMKHCRVSTRGEV